MAGINIPLTATQTPAECGADVRTIDDTRWGKYRAVRADFLARIIFRKWLKMKRKNMDLTQYDLGRLSGVGRGAVAQYEQGRRFPDGRNMERLLDALRLKEREKETMFRQLYRNV